jgi:hypothetical protein
MLFPYNDTTKTIISYFYFNDLFHFGSFVAIIEFTHHSISSKDFIILPTTKFAVGTTL